ncbi:MAG: hypothetical protein QOC87_977 [Actinomycetota bacterium]|nr:hypothetical protein [Actinomycetota bacterium]
MATTAATAPVWRRADPYLDTDVIDARAPRFNQATVGTLSAIAVITGAWWLLALLGLQLIVGLRFGRKYCLPCVFYFEVVQPRLGEGEIEDSRPPRFANIVGAVFLSSATLSYAFGFVGVGQVLGGMVAVLALLAASTGLCVGCELYKIGARMRGIRSGTIDVIDLQELGVDGTDDVVVEFTHPLCTGCRELEFKLTARGDRPILIDISEKPEIAHRYNVGVVPLAYRVDASGRVVERLA